MKSRGAPVHHFCTHAPDRWTRPEGCGFHYEIIYGRRRHAVCLGLDAELEGGFRVLALLDVASRMRSWNNRG